MAAGVLFVGRDFRKTPAEVGDFEHRVVAKSSRTAHFSRNSTVTLSSGRKYDWRNFVHGLGHPDHDDMTRKVSLPVFVADRLERFQQFSDIVGIRRRFDPIAGVSRGIDAGSAVQGVDAEAGGVGQNPLGALAFGKRQAGECERPGLDGGVGRERVAVFVNVRCGAENRRPDDLDGRVREDPSDLLELVGVPGADQKAYG